jgi:anaerobic ribonucleoside-triphosphate reductase|nr:anaerobic ribonucleoside-triphosphate reductase [uncultured Oscillibacter sp.]
MKDNSKKLIGEGRDFERIRRITGYLTGTLDGWNSAKRAEEKDRVKHPVNTNRRE